MYSNIVKDLYIGKSKLTFEANDKILSDTLTIGDLFQETGYENPKMPDYGAYGSLFFYTGKSKWVFEITPKSDHLLFVTGIPKKDTLDNYRLKDAVWSSYYEDDYRGYLFQIIVNMEVEPKLIIDDGGN